MLDLTRLRSHSIQATQQPMSHVALAMRMMLIITQSPFFSNMPLFLPPSFAKAGKYTLVLETLSLQRMDLWNNGENGRQGFRRL